MVKGPSCLSAVPHFDIIQGTTVDYMHCVLLGVCRQQLRLWLESKYHKEPWYIASKIDECLCAICPPSEMSRTPRSIKQHENFGKVLCMHCCMYRHTPCIQF